MMNKLVPVSLLLTLSLCACGELDGGSAPLTEKQTKKLAKYLDGKVAEKPVHCLPGFQTKNIVRISDNMVIYRVSKKLVYQNKLRSNCPGLARDSDIIVTESYTGNQCEGDLLYLVDRQSGFRGPTCSFGEFIPYRAPKK